MRIRESPTVHVPVGVSELFGLAEPDAVDDGGVVELVGKDGVVGPQQLLEDARVGVEAAGVRDGGLATVEAGDLGLEVLETETSSCNFNS